LPPVRLRARAAALLVLVLAFALAGCKVDTTTDVVIRQDGSGTVGVTVDLDAEAVQAIGGVDTLRTADLERAGWQVAPTAAQAGGGVTVSATKRFAGPGELSAIFEEINGPGGPFLQPRYERQRSTFRNRYHFHATIDLTAPLAALDDPKLRDLLTANGADVDRLRSDYATKLPDAVTAHLVVTMPGSGSRSWDAAARQRVEADVSTSSTRNAQVTKVLVAAVLALIGLGVAVTGGVRALWGRLRGRLARAGPVPDPDAAAWYEDEWQPGLDDAYGAYGPYGPYGPYGGAHGAPEDGEDAEERPPEPVPPGWDPYGSDPDPRRG
jgi:hypothetical protein